MLTLTGSVGVFVATDGATSITHQLQFDVGFNLAPDTPAPASPPSCSIWPKPPAPVSRRR